MLHCPDTYNSLHMLQHRFILRYNPMWLLLCGRERTPGASQRKGHQRSKGSVSCLPVELN
uniref:Uncharacterized protein n=1 Tax=Arundo donax TaxID=35708 RepID=A0A0A8Z6J2_ARUDO